MQQEEKICKAQNFYFMLLSTSNLSSQPPPNNQSWPSDWLKIYWKNCFCEDIKRKKEKETSASGCCLAQILLVPCPNGWHTAILIFWRSAFRTRFSSPWICHAWFTIDYAIIIMIFMLIGSFLSHSSSIITGKGGECVSYWFVWCWQVIKQVKLYWTRQWKRIQRAEGVTQDLGNRDNRGRI